MKRGSTGNGVRRNRAGAVLTVSALFAASAGMAHAASLHRFTDVAIDRAGRYVATVEGTSAEDVLKVENPAVMLRDSKNSGEIRIAQCSDCDYTGIAVSAAGGVTYLVRGVSGKTDVIVRDGSRERTLSTIDGFASSPAWSPDGKSLALLVTIAPRKELGPTQAGVRDVGELGAASDRQRLAVISAETGDLRFASPEDMFVFEFDWMPDGGGFVGIGTIGDGDNDWYLSGLYAFDARTTGARLIASPERQIIRARISGDGRSVAYVSGLMSDYNQGGGDVFVVPVTGGTPRNLTPDADSSFMSVAWNGRRIVASAVKGDAMAIYSIDPANDARQEIWNQVSTVSAKGSRHGMLFSGDGRAVAGIREHFDQGPEILAGKISAPRQITRANAGIAGVASSRSVTWQSDGMAVQGWLVTPNQARPGQRLPLVVLIHGGPAAYGGPDFIWDGWRKALLEKGYALFMPNFRGSAGRGEVFKRANIKDFGKGDLRDILTGVDHLSAIGAIDGDRVGITGFSYGGFMSMWAVTQTGRFKAAAAGASVANWISYYGQNGIDKWLLPYFGGSPYRNPEPYNAASPINFVANVRTPTFIYVGERDIETPPVQSREFWKALKELDVPTSMVVYADEGHRIRNPANAADATRRIVDWFERYMPAEKR